MKITVSKGELMTEFRYDTQLLIEDIDRQASRLKV